MCVCAIVLLRCSWSTIVQYTEADIAMIATLFVLMLLLCLIKVIKGRNTWYMKRHFYTDHQSIFWRAIFPHTDHWWMNVPVTDKTIVILNVDIRGHLCVVEKRPICWPAAQSFSFMLRSRDMVLAIQRAGSRLWQAGHNVSIPSISERGLRQ